MTLDQFAILLDNPSMSYSPGQRVSGRVLIRANSQENTQGLNLIFDGRATVHWTEEDIEYSGTGSNKREERVTKYFNGFESFFQFKNDLLGDGRSDVKIPSGESSYPFSFQLPTNIPSSFVGRYGKVEYILLANVKRSLKDYNAMQEIRVNAIVDLNNDQEASQPAELTTSKKFCCLCCASGPLTMNIRLKTKGFCPGEIIPLEVEVNNLSSRVITDMSAEIFQAAAFFAQGRTIYDYKLINSSKRGSGVGAGESEIWRAELEIPPVPPTKLGGCRIIDVYYGLKVTAHVSGVAFDLKIDCKIIIGTVPLIARFNSSRF